jgi:adenylate cyclase
MSHNASNETWWREYLLRGHRSEGVARKIFPFLPAPPRCKVCYVPFGGIVGKMLGAVGWAPSRKNPHLCSRCCDRLPAGGAEIEIAVFFADVRGYTTVAEKLPPAQLAQAMQQFYQIAVQAVISHDGLVDKLLGDAVMALFVPGVAGADYRRQAIRVAAQLARDLPSLPIGIGIHAGLAYVGNLGSHQVVDLTAIGDTVNIASRLQSVAAAGELLITEEMAALAVENFRNLESRVVRLKGKEQPMTVRVLHSLR